ncbi:uncharacterized protein LOC110705460 [Chenopodium quinoa]|uniref:Uncharacterized protein n=1 Tax=Chenopodium quinoa TaxID=63459 RepID=A0A803LBC6_CHEQI|nr:uncharacterized protein LOC110705460 [Chenopodium quinoa]
MAATNPLNPQNPNSPLSAESYHPMLQESIQLFLSQIQSGISDFSHFNLMFSRLIHTMPSPPIEIVWFYSAVNFHTHKKLIAQKNLASQDDNLGRILAIKELFQSLVACSGPCSSSLQKVAVLAPLIFELYNLVLDLKVNARFSLDKTITIEIGCLVERLVSYISLCCCEGVDDHDDTIAFSPCFVDLVKVWTVQRREIGFEFKDDFKMFFPMISDEARNGLLVGSRVGVLAGIVMCQTFLLSLCLKFGLEDPQEKLKEDVLNSAANSIIGFRSCYFFDTLLKMLLEFSLPVTSLLTVVDEVLLREALFDAIILVDYPFFNPGCGIRLCSHHLNSLASTWLFVADKAMKFVWHKGDQTKVISYMKAFSKSLIHSQLLKWVSTQIVMAEDTNNNISTPAAFMEWLVQLTSQTSKGFFNDEFSMLLEKAMNYISEMKTAVPYLALDGNYNFCIDQKVGENGGADEDFEMIDSTEGSKTGCSTTLTANDECRKRKGEKDEGGIRVKLLKYQMHDSPIKSFSPFQNEVGLIRRS